MSKKRILVIEDNLDNMVLIADLLRKLQYDVIEAMDGEQGIRVSAAEMPDLILMDLSLPRMDGCEATRAIKSSPALSHIPVIAVTAHAMHDDRERAREAGCDDYIVKPINMRDLGQKISQYLT
jgi:two-component system cell cycle response regulator DivK